MLDVFVSTDGDSLFGLLLRKIQRGVSDLGMSLGLLRALPDYMQPTFNLIDFT